MVKTTMLPAANENACCWFCRAIITPFVLFALTGLILVLNGCNPGMTPVCPAYHFETQQVMRSNVAEINSRYTGAYYMSNCFAKVGTFADEISAAVSLQRFPVGANFSMMVNNLDSTVCYFDSDSDNTPRGLTLTGFLILGVSLFPFVLFGIGAVIMLYPYNECRIPRLPARP